MLWLIAANPNKYDIDAAFDELQLLIGQRMLIIKRMILYSFMSVILFNV